MRSSRLLQANSSPHSHSGLEQKLSSRLCCLLCVGSCSVVVQFFLHPGVQRKCNFIRLPFSHSYWCLFLRITAELSLFEVTGLDNQRSAPTLLSSKKAATAGTPLLSLLFEINPMDESSNQKLHVQSQPLEIIYDAVSAACHTACLTRTNHRGAKNGKQFVCDPVQMTVNTMSEFFKPPGDVQLDELTNATLMKLEQFRDRTATGQSHFLIKASVMTA